MANLSVTLRCNQACDYCFAAGISQAVGTGHDELGDLRTGARVSEAVRASEEARFLGGEPTLHPRLSDMLQEAVRLGFRTLLFSNGLLPGGGSGTVAGTPDRPLLGTHQLDAARDRRHPRTQVLLQGRTLAALGPRTSAWALTSGSQAPGCDFLLDYGGAVRS